MELTGTEAKVFVCVCLYVRENCFLSAYLCKHESCMCVLVHVCGVRKYVIRPRNATISDINRIYGPPKYTHTHSHTTSLAQWGGLGVVCKIENDTAQTWKLPAFGHPLKCSVKSVYILALNIYIYVSYINSIYWLAHMETSARHIINIIIMMIIIMAISGAGAQSHNSGSAVEANKWWFVAARWKLQHARPRLPQRSDRNLWRWRLTFGTCIIQWQFRLDGV